MDTTPRDSTATVRLHVRELLSRGRHDLAEPAVRRVLAVSPDDAEAVRQLASCLSARFALTEALAQARRAVSLAVRSVSAQLTLALVYDRLGNVESAVGACRAALEIDPYATGAHAHLADLSLQRNRYDECLDWTARGLAISPSDPAMLRDRATALAGLGRSAEAVAAIADLLVVDPDGALTHAGIGNAYKLLRRFDDAARHLLQALTRNPLHPELHTQLGYVRLGQGRIDEARAHFADTLKLHPDRPAAIRGQRKAAIRPLWDRAKAARAAGDHVGCEKLLRESLAIDPTNSTIMVDLARTLLVLRRHAEALRTATEAVDLRTDSPIGRYTLGQVLLVVEQFDGALAQGTQALRLKPDVSLSYRVSGEALIELGRADEALAVLHQGLAIKPHLGTLAGLRAVALAWIGRKEEAVTAAAAALSHRPKDPELNRLAGQTYLALGRLDDAEAHFQRSLVPDALRGTTGYLGLGLTHLARGDPERARPYLAEAVRLNPLGLRAQAAVASMSRAPLDGNC